MMCRSPARSTKSRCQYSLRSCTLRYPLLPVFWGWNADDLIFSFLKWKKKNLHCLKSYSQWVGFQSVQKNFLQVLVRVKRPKWSLRAKFILTNPTFHGCNFLPNGSIELILHVVVRQPERPPRTQRLVHSSTFFFRKFNTLGNFCLRELDVESSCAGVSGPYCFHRDRVKSERFSSLTKECKFFFDFSPQPILAKKNFTMFEILLTVSRISKCAKFFFANKNFE